MRNFNDYKPEEGNTFSKDGLSEAELSEKFFSLAEEFEGKNGDDVLKAIVKEAERGRKNGTLSDDDIDNFAALVLPMINPEQQKTLEKVVKRLKKK